MPIFQKSNPYNGFKSDIERRRALNFRAVCITLCAFSPVLDSFFIILFNKII